MLEFLIFLRNEQFLGRPVAGVGWLEWSLEWEGSNLLRVNIRQQRVYRCSPPLLLSRGFISVAVIAPVCYKPILGT